MYMHACMHTCILTHTHTQKKKNRAGPDEPRGVAVAVGGPHPLLQRLRRTAGRGGAGGGALGGGDEVAEEDGAVVEGLRLLLLLL